MVVFQGQTDLNRLIDCLYQVQDLSQLRVKIDQQKLQATDSETDKMEEAYRLLAILEKKLRGKDHSPQKCKDIWKGLGESFRRDVGQALTAKLQTKFEIPLGVPGVLARRNCS